MAVFAYKALDPSQVTLKGTVSADTPRQARAILRAQGLAVQLLAEHRRSDGFPWWSRLLSARCRHQWAAAVHELAMLLGAGIPMLEALDTIAQQHRGRFRVAILGVRDRVAAGAGLAEALVDRPDLFDPLSVHLIEVGENSGNLEDVLDRLADFKQRMLQLKDGVVTALLYPAFLFVFGVVAAVFLMTFVLPPLLENLQESVDKLPWPTLVVKWCSDVLVAYRWPIGIGTLAAVVTAIAVFETAWGRGLWQRTLLRLPLIGPLVLKQTVARTAMILSTLCRSGVVLTDALKLAARSANNVVVERALADCANRVGTGQDMAEALEQSGHFPPLALRVFSVGQETGRLPEMLARLAEDYDRQVTGMSARIAALLEPVLILVLACFVGFLLLATILPILEAGNVF